MQCDVDNLEAENSFLVNRYNEMEAENQRLGQEVDKLKKALEKQKNFHRKFADDVVESERIRNDDFKSQKKSLTESNKHLVQENRQLTKDVAFYKKAFEELVKESETNNRRSNERPATKISTTNDDHSCESSTVQSKRSSPRLAMKASSTQVSDVVFDHSSISSQMVDIYRNNNSKQRSSKTLSKISEKLFLENKTLKIKINNLNATLLIMKKNNRKLENIIEKMNKQKLKHEQDVDELAALVDSTKMKNKDTFTPDVLVQLQRYSNL